MWHLTRSSARSSNRSSNRSPAASGRARTGPSENSERDRSAADFPGGERDQTRKQTGAADQRTLDAGPASAWRKSNRFKSAQIESAEPASAQHGLAAGKVFLQLGFFFEPEQPKTSGRRILLLVALLAALGVAGWWTYTNYLGAMESRKPEAATSNAGEASTEKPSTKAAASNAVPAVDAGGSQAAVPAARAPESHAEKASAAPEPRRKTADAAAKSEAKPVTPGVTPKIALGDKSAEKRELRATSAKTSKLPAPAAADSGAADFRKGEAYLYGRGAPKNCDQAVKYLKAASNKSSAKARSAFGTMYATGHCVPRDLPTSYSWFALALRADPNNQILEKDLSAIWKQMTPPERQMATRMKQ